MLKLGVLCGWLLQLGVGVLSLVLAAVVLRDLAVGLQVDVILEVQRELILQRGDPQLLGVEWASLESSWDEGSTARGCR